MVSKQLAILALATALAGGAASAAEDTARTITVAAEGRVEAAPDMAVISLGVVNEAATAGKAMSATSAAAARVLDRLAGFAIDPRDIQTSQLTLNPVWTSDADGGRSKITGFSATNALTVRVRDLDRLGEIMDAVIEDGANDFNGLSFAVAEPAPLIDAARARAVAEARSIAAQLAAGAGVGLGPVQSISEQGGGMPRPQMMEAFAARSAVPVAAGEVTLSVTVSMVFAIDD
jgi:uncharacterized protein YggE